MRETQSWISHVDAADWHELKYRKAHLPPPPLSIIITYICPWSRLGFRVIGGNCLQLRSELFRGKRHKTVECLSVRPSVRPSRRSTAAAVAGRFAAEFGRGQQILNSLSSIFYGNMTSLAAKCDIYSPLLSTPNFEIKLHVSNLFEKTVVN